MHRTSHKSTGVRQRRPFPRTVLNAHLAGHGQLPECQKVVTIMNGCAHLPDMACRVLMLQAQLLLPVPVTTRDDHEISAATE